MFLKTSFLDRADKFKLAICNKTGLIAIYNLEKNLFLSPYVDGPMDVRFQMDADAIDCRLNTTTRFGRSFSVVEIPYAFKLFLQELQVLGIQARILTNKNIDCVMSLLGTKNVINLTSDASKLRSQASSLQKYVQGYTKQILEKMNSKKQKKDKKKTKDKPKNPKRKVIAQNDELEDKGTDQESLEGNEEKEQEKEKEKQKGGEDDSPVLFTLNDQPIEIPDTPPMEKLAESNQNTVGESVPESVIINPSPASLVSSADKSEALTAVLKVEEPKKEESEEDGQKTSAPGTTKSITLDGL
jgi:DNA-directed RNA polymerase II subunit RPB2